MLGYYRNPLNNIFFNESCIVCSLYSFGTDKPWKSGVDMDELFERSCYIADLIKREEVLEFSITPDNRAYFMKTLEFMQSQRLLTIKDNLITFKSSGEAMTLLIGSICWPMIDTYYVVLVFALSMAKNKNVHEAKFPKDV